MSSNLFSHPRPWLLGAALSSFAIALLHLVIPVAGAPAYRYFGAGSLVPMLERGSWIPALVTVAIACVFGVFGLYALSGAGMGRRLPLLRSVLTFVGVVFCLRGLLLARELAALASGISFPPRALVFSGVSMGVGLLFLGGVLALRLARR